jgi:hypothetical protein
MELIHHQIHANTLHVGVESVSERSPVSLVAVDLVQVTDRRFLWSGWRVEVPGRAMAAFMISPFSFGQPRGKEMQATTLDGLSFSLPHHLNVLNIIVDSSWSEAAPTPIRDHLLEERIQTTVESLVPKDRRQQ